MRAQLILVPAVLDPIQSTVFVRFYVIIRLSIPYKSILKNISFIRKARRINETILVSSPPPNADRTTYLSTNGFIFSSRGYDTSKSPILLLSILPWVMFLQGQSVNFYWFQRGIEIHWGRLERLFDIKVYPRRISPSLRKGFDSTYTIGLKGYMPARPKLWIKESRTMAFLTNSRLAGTVSWWHLLASKHYWLGELSLTGWESLTFQYRFPCKF